MMVVLGRRRLVAVRWRGPLHIIGGPTTGGCIAGAMSLPAQGPGFQTIHLDRSAFWGAPSTITQLELLGREAAAAGLPTLLVEDISRARGGPMPGGHVSHQIGLDVDVGLDMQARGPLSAGDRETVELRSMVRPDGRDIDPAAWSGRVITLLHMATGLPEVDRILVNPAIKQQLCRDVTGDRSWLRWIRPWYGACGAYAYLIPLPGGTGRLHSPGTAAGGGWVRCHAAVVVRSVERAAEAGQTVSAATAAGGVQGDPGWGVGGGWLPLTLAWVALGLGSSPGSCC